jgi:hypothetical protein
MAVTMAPLAKKENYRQIILVRFRVDSQSRNWKESRQGYLPAGTSDDFYIGFKTGEQRMVLSTALYRSMNLHYFIFFRHAFVPKEKAKAESRLDVGSSRLGVVVGVDFFLLFAALAALLFASAAMVKVRFLLFFRMWMDGKRGGVGVEN